jgi:hypothetical protein
MLLRDVDELRLFIVMNCFYLRIELL